MKDIYKTNDVISQISFDRDNYNKFMEYLVDLKLSGKDLSYVDFVSKGAACSNDKLDSNRLENLAEMVYNHWKDTIASNKFCDGGSMEKIREQLMNSTYFDDNEVSKQGYLQTLCSLSKEIHSHTEDRQNWKKFNLLNDQNFFQDNSVNVNQNGDFLHIFNSSAWEEIPDVRLYLNLKTKNTLQVATNLYSQSLEKDFPLYFKFCANDNRNDNFVIYSNYQNVLSVIDALKSLKEEQPDLFSGAENFNPLLGNVDNFIGFGEQPEYMPRTSFMLEREGAITSLINSEINKVIDINLLYEDDEKLIGDAVVNILNNKLNDIENNSTKKEIMKNIITEQVKKDLPRLVRDYVDQVQDNFEDNSFAKDYLIASQNGEQNTIHLTKSDIDSYLISNNNLKEDLLENICDEQTQEDYFLQNHVSSNRPYLNRETQDRLSVIEERKQQETNF